jgi:hypothetical protein
MAGLKRRATAIYPRCGGPHKIRLRDVYKDIIHDGLVYYYVIFSTYADDNVILCYSNIE